MDDKIKFFDLFGGIGGFRLGLEGASSRFRCCGYIDKDRFAVQSYNQIFDEEHEPTDIRELSEKEIEERWGEADIVCAGFPCQSFSIAGERGGFEDTRGTLFFEVCRVIEAIEPEVVLLENVKGLLSSGHEDENYTDFRTVLESLARLGYDAEWQVLNSKDFGVAQNRERVFIIGFPRGEPRPEVFPIRGEDKRDYRKDGRERDKLIHPTISGAIGRAGSSSEYLNSLKQVNRAESKILRFRPRYKKGDRTLEPYLYNNITPTIKSNVATGDQKNYIINQQMRPESRPSIQEGQSGGSGILFNDEYSYALSSSPHYVREVREYDREDGLGKPLDVIPAINKSDWRGLNRNQRQACIMEINQIGSRYGKQSGGVYDKTGISPTIHYGKRGPMPHMIPEPKKRIRKLTPKECWRLQGFPDWAFERAKEVNSDTQLYRQAGNAATVNVVRYLGGKLINYFNEVF